MNAASIFSDLSSSATLARSLFPAPLAQVRISIAPQRAPLATLPPPVRAARMMTTVRRIAARIARGLPRHVDFEDLVGAGSLGLAEAFSRRNGMPGDQFEAFASYRIRGAILDELRRLDVMSRRDRSMWKRMEKAGKVVAKRLGAPGDDAEVAAELGLRPSVYRGLRTDLETQREPLSLSTVLGREEGDAREIADTSAEFPEEAATRTSASELALARLAELPERMRHVLLGLYANGQTLKEVGAELGVTESRACQIRREALKRLRAALAEGTRASGAGEN